jgi:hypothetical protein
VSKPICFLVDQIEVTSNREICIYTAYESMNKIFPIRLNRMGWGNMFALREHNNTVRLIDPDIRYDTLDNVAITENEIYIYLIPCRTELDVGDINYLFMLPDYLLQKIAENNISVLFDYSIEFYHFINHGTHHITKCFDLLVSLNSKYSKPIILSSANKNLNIVRRIDNRINSINLPLRAIRDRYSYVNSGIDVDLDRYFLQPKQFLYLHLNMQPRLHRLALIHRLDIENLEHLSRTSFMSDILKNVSPMTTNTKIDASWIPWLAGNNERLQRTTVDDQTFQNLVLTNLPAKSLSNDILIKTQNKNFLYNLEWVYDTCFDLVSETGTFVNYPDNSPAITEKLFKSIFYKRPFIVNGDSNNLSFLKSFGFQTFNGLFDESYDQYDHMFDRHKIITNNIKAYKDNYFRLMKKIKEYKSVLEHNYTHLVTIGNLEKVTIKILNDAVNLR